MSHSEGQNGLSIEVIVALAIGIPAFLVALATLWFAYQDHRDKQKFKFLCWRI